MRDPHTIGPNSAVQQISIRMDSDTLRALREGEVALRALGVRPENRSAYLRRIIHEARDGYTQKLAARAAQQ
jgi:hypothetical protein